MTVALQIRDVPDEVRDTLASAARSHGQSLQAFLLEMVEREARYFRNIEILYESHGHASGGAAAALEALDAARSEQDAKNMGKHR